MDTIKMRASDLMAGDVLVNITSSPTVTKLIPLGNGMVEVKTTGKTYVFTRSTMLKIVRSASETLSDVAEYNAQLASETDSEEAASAGVEVASVVTGDAILAVRNMAILIAYRTWGRTGMKLARNFQPTVREWNEMTGQSLRTRAQVGEAADKLIKEIRAQRDAQ